MSCMLGDSSPGSGKLPKLVEISLTLWVKSCRDRYLSTRSRSRSRVPRRSIAASASLSTGLVIPARPLFPFRWSLGKSWLALSMFDMRHAFTSIGMPNCFQHWASSSEQILASHSQKLKLQPFAKNVKLGTGDPCVSGQPWWASPSEHAWRVLWQCAYLLVC